MALSPVVGGPRGAHTHTLPLCRAYAAAAAAAVASGRTSSSSYYIHLSAPYACILPVARRRCIVIAFRRRLLTYAVTFFFSYYNL